MKDGSLPARTSSVVPVFLPTIIVGIYVTELMRFPVRNIGIKLPEQVGRKKFVSLSTLPILALVVILTIYP